MLALAGRKLALELSTRLRVRDARFACSGDPARVGRRREGRIGAELVVQFRSGLVGRFTSELGWLVGNFGRGMGGRWRVGFRSTSGPG